MTIKHPNAPHDCLLCNVDAVVQDPDERASVYLVLADFARSQGTAWDRYVDPCRKHHMMLPRGMAKLSDVFEKIGGGAADPYHLRKIAECEIEIQRLHDEREDRHVDSSS